MSSAEIHQIANELKARGITPTTAMVKARLSQAVPMAELLKSLSQWKQSQLKDTKDEPIQSPHDMDGTPQSDQAPLIHEPSVQSLAAQLDRLEQKLDRLLTLMTHPR
ncbi:MAG: hypothetical protein WBF70_14720 [Aeromonas molluscorum]